MKSGSPFGRFSTLADPKQFVEIVFHPTRSIIVESPTI